VPYYASTEEPDISHSSSKSIPDLTRLHLHSAPTQTDFHKNASKPGPRSTTSRGCLNATPRIKPRHGILPGMTLPPTLDQLRDGGAAADIFRRPIARSLPTPAARENPRSRGSTAPEPHHGRGAGARHGSESKLRGPREPPPGESDRSRDLEADAAEAPRPVWFGRLFPVPSSSDSQSRGSFNFFFPPFCFSLLSGWSFWGRCFRCCG
jgi:hypothetical protein